MTKKNREAKTQVISQTPNTGKGNEYYILLNGEEVTSYCSPYAQGLDCLKLAIQELKDNEPSIEDKDIEIYVKTKLKVKTYKVVEIIEE